MMLWWIRACMYGPKLADEMAFIDRQAELLRQGREQEAIENGALWLKRKK